MNDATKEKLEAIRKRDFRLAIMLGNFHDYFEVMVEVLADNDQNEVRDCLSNAKVRLEQIQVQASIH